MQSVKKAFISFEQQSLGKGTFRIGRRKVEALKFKDQENCKAFDISDLLVLLLVFNELSELGLLNSGRKPAVQQCC
jgi:hypothetical protein